MLVKAQEPISRSIEDSMESSGYAEVFLPLEDLDVKNIVIHPPTSSYPIRIPLSIVSYTSTFTMPKLSILTPFLKVHSWDASKGRLEVVATEVLPVIRSLEETILQKLVKNPNWSSLTSHTYEEVKGRFQPLIINSILRFYTNNQDSEGITVYNNTIIEKLSETTFHPGQYVRIALRFQGLVFLKNCNGGLFYRLQHQITRIYCKESIITNY